MGECFQLMKRVAGVALSQPTSLERTTTKLPIDFSMHLMHKLPSRSDHLSAPDNSLIHHLQIVKEPFC